MDANIPRALRAQKVHLWAFLTRPENDAHLETASELSKPAVEGIEEHLLAEFREEVLADRVKQMVGQIGPRSGGRKGSVGAILEGGALPAARTGSRSTPSATPAIRAITDRRQNAVLPSDVATPTTRANFVAEFLVLRTFVPGPMRNALIVLMLMRRRAGIETVPYAFFTFAYGNEVLQVAFAGPMHQRQASHAHAISEP